jgi:membrane protease YdiL (CAAX protease family)
LDLCSNTAIFLIFLAAAGASLVAALFFHPFTLPAQKKPFLSVLSPLFAYFLYFIGVAIVPAKVIGLLSPFLTGDLEKFVIAILLAFLASALLLLALTAIHPKGAWHEIFGSNHLRAITKGIVWGILSFPVLIITVHIVHMVVDFFGAFPRGEQAAIGVLKKVRGDPILFWSFSFLTVTLVPFTEELLFRGYFLNFLAGKLGAKGGVAFTSILFALFHFTVAQKMANVELMVGLFLISWAISTLYLREKSLFAPIALHATFNGLSIFFYTIAPALS